MSASFIYCNMKKIIPVIILTLLLAYLLAFPARMAADTAAGLLLWYRSVVPTLLPFCIISYIIIQSSLYHSIFYKLAVCLPGRKRFCPEALYPLCLGLVCGFPIGAKLTSDLYAMKRISSAQATAVCAASNHFGPAFVINYIALSLPDGAAVIPVLIIAIYIPPLLFGWLWILRTGPAKIPQKKPASRSEISFKIIDAGIINGFETMLRIAGYIVVFSILAGALQQLSLPIPVLKNILAGILEVTTGAQALTASSLTEYAKIILLSAVVSFGGLCGLFQTNAIMKNTDFRAVKYILFKLLCSITGAVLSAGLLLFFF